MGVGWGDISCPNKVMFLVHIVSKSISEFDKEIIQSYTSDQPTAPWLLETANTSFIWFHKAWT